MLQGGTRTEPEPETGTVRTIFQPSPSFPFLLGKFLFFFFPCLVFLSVCPFFSGDFRGSVGIKHPFFWGGFSCLFPQKQRKGRTGWKRNWSWNRPLLLDSTETQRNPSSPDKTAEAENRSNTFHSQTVTEPNRGHPGLVLFGEIFLGNEKCGRTFSHKLFEPPQASGTSRQNSRDAPDSFLQDPRKTNFRRRARTFRPPILH